MHVLTILHRILSTNVPEIHAKRTLGGRKHKKGQALRANHSV
jgi:hypothetical protein